MIYLMNSSMMPEDGAYDCRTISKQDFVAIINKAKEIKCHIGYANTVEFVNKITGKDFTESRTPAKIKDGDLMLICRLKYRPANPETKGIEGVKDNEYEFKYTLYRKYNYEV